MTFTLKTLLRHPIKTLREDKAFDEFAEMRDITWREYLWATFVLVPWWIMQAWACGKFFKHDYVEEYGDPENGSFYVECRRCGHTISGHW